jgi:hypothetical protein
VTRGGQGAADGTPGGRSHGRTDGPADDSALGRAGGPADDPSLGRPEGPGADRSRGRGRFRTAIVGGGAAVAAIGVVAVATSAGGAGAEPPATYAPLSATPPALSPTAAQLAAALKCPPSLAGAPRAPVLLVAGTGVTPEQNFDWGWKVALAKRGVPQCTIALPHQGLGDIQTAGEYVAFAIRTMFAASGRRISIVGHSQGGMVPRWALRFFGDTRAMVDDVIGLAPDNHGVPAGDVVRQCAQNGCPAPTLQQAAGSRFLEALNSRFEAFDGISYTTIRTRTDEILTPGDAPDDQASSSLRSPQGRITNVAIQDVCPSDQSTHRLIGTLSNTAFELAMDALDHDGPADPERARPPACATQLLPGVDASKVQANLANLGALTDADRAAVPLVREEPPLKSYVGGRFDAEPAAVPVTPPVQRAQLTVQPSRVTVGRRVRLRIRAFSTTGRPLSRQRIAVLGRTVRTGRDGRATVVVRPARAGSTTARATGNGLPVATTKVRVVR